MQVIISSQQGLLKLWGCRCSTTKKLVQGLVMARVVTFGQCGARSGLGSYICYYKCFDTGARENGFNCSGILAGNLGGSENGLEKDVDAIPMWWQEGRVGRLSKEQQREVSWKGQGNCKVYWMNSMWCSMSLRMRLDEGIENSRVFQILGNSIT